MTDRYDEYVPPQIRDNVPEGSEVRPDFRCLGGFKSEIQAIFEEELAGITSVGNGASRKGGTDPASSSTLRARDAGGGQ